MGSDVSHHVLDEGEESLTIRGVPADCAVILADKHVAAMLCPMGRMERSKVYRVLFALGCVWVCSAAGAAEVGHPAGDWTSRGLVCGNMFGTFTGLMYQTGFRRPAAHFVAGSLGGFVDPD